MRTTVTLDDEMVAKAIELTGVKERSAVINRALKELVQREAGRRLALLGGTQPDAQPASRRRPPGFLNSDEDQPA